MDIDPDDPPGNTIEKPAFRLALAGYIPFLALCAWLVAIADDHVWRADTILLLKAYGAVILSFLGGIRFGLAVAEDDEGLRPSLAGSVVPALVAWIGLWLPDPAAFALLAGAFAAQGAWDSISAHRGEAPAWFGRMRIVLTALVVLAMVAAFLETA
jgi:hypothetical protein